MLDAGANFCVKRRNPISATAADIMLPSDVAGPYLAALENCIFYISSMYEFSHGLREAVFLFVIMLQCMSLLVALRGQTNSAVEWSLLGNNGQRSVPARNCYNAPKRTQSLHCEMSACEPKRTSGAEGSCRRSRYALSEKPQIASSAATTRPTHETVMETEWGPICTVHPLKILQPCKIATNAKMSAVINA